MTAPTDDLDLARAFAAAIDRGDDQAAAMLMAEDVEVVLPGGRVVSGRHAWLAGRRAQSPATHMDERFEDVVLRPAPGGVHLEGRLVQRWTETGEVAHEQPLEAQLDIEGGLIRRFELRPGSQ